MTKPQKTFSEQLRQAMKLSGRSRYKLWKATGIDQATLSRFAAGTGGLSIEAIDELWKVLGLHLAFDTTSGTADEGIPKSKKGK